jgi:hypothetical protein
MKKTKLTALRKVFSALAFVLAITIYTGSNSVAYAAATKPATTVNAAPDDFKAPKLTVVWDNHEGDAWYQPRKDAMSKEEAAQFGAKYIWEMFGESIDGKAVRMLYRAIPNSYSKTYWNGYVFNSKADSNKNTPLFTFEIDAVTGEWISISSDQKPKIGGVNGKIVTNEEYYAMLEQPPEQLDEYIKIAKAFAQKHFKNSKVADAEFFTQLPNAEILGEGDTREVFEKGWIVIITVIDDTGRKAEVNVDMDKKQAYMLGTSNSDRTDGRVLVVA